MIHDSLTLDVALNPDFSQVESDDPQVTVNQRFEVFFPEKRPFFLENTGYFSTDADGHPPLFGPYWQEWRRLRENTCWFTRSGKSWFHCPHARSGNHSLENISLPAKMRRTNNLRANQGSSGTSVEPEIPPPHGMQGYEHHSRASALKANKRRTVGPVFRITVSELQLPPSPQ